MTPLDPEDQDLRGVVVRDVRMPFFSMVVFMVKWSLAAIPAMLILTFIGIFGGLLAWSTITGLVRGISHSAREAEAPATNPVTRPWEPSRGPLATPDWDHRRPPEPSARARPPVLESSSDYIARHVSSEVDLLKTPDGTFAVCAVLNNGNVVVRSVHGVLLGYAADGTAIFQVPYTLKDLRAGELRQTRDQVPDLVRTVRLEIGGGVLSR